MPWIAILLQKSFAVPHIGNAAGHPCRKIAARGADDHNPPAGHILAAVVPHAFNHRRGAGITHRETLTGQPAEKRLAHDSPVQNHIARDHVLFRDILCPVRRENDDTPAGKPLAHIIIGFTFKGKADPMGQKSAEALARRTIKFNLDGVIRQSRQSVFTGDLAGKHGAHGTVDITDI